MPDDPTLGELARRVDRLDVRMDTRAVSLTTYHAERAHDRDEVATLRRETVEARTDLGAEIAALRVEIRAVSDRIGTTFRLAATGVLAPIIVGVVLWLITRTGG